MLNEMREGRLTESSTAAFRKLSRPLNFEDMLDATELFPTRNEVEGANANRLSLLQGNVFPFPAKDGGSIADKGQRDRLLANCLAPELITLKKGAQVMLIKNIDETLVNGSLGRVIGFMDERQFDSYNNNEDAFMQSPGGTVQSTADAAAAAAAGEIPERPRMMEGITTSRKWPLVRFAIADGTWRDLLCQPETWKVELPNGEVQASRAQVPLILAWALSIHKAQGQTLERVKVDLGRVFEKGQAYVALSRATSMAGLQVLRFDPKKVNAHERVRTFYSKLARVELAEKNKDRMEGIKSKAPATTTARSYEESFVDGDFL
jgi:ATP-dependent DNA helicase PIF1